MVMTFLSIYSLCSPGQSKVDWYKTFSFDSGSSRSCCLAPKSAHVPHVSVVFDKYLPSELVRTNFIFPQASTDSRNQR